MLDRTAAEHLGGAMPRIIAGVARGRRLKVPPAGTRPTTDRVRESLFGALEHMLGGFAGLRFLDLYAGSGALGLEALSRGAQSVVLVESDSRTAAVARANVATVGLPGVEMRAQSVAAFLAGSPEPFDAVLADPPYALSDARITAVLERLVQGWLAEGAVVVVERQSSDEVIWPSGIVAQRRSTFGTTALWYGQAVLFKDRQ